MPCPTQGPEQVHGLPRMLLDIQNRGQLAAGFTTYNPHRKQLIDTYKDVGTVAEVFRLNHRGNMTTYAGYAGGMKIPGMSALRHLRPG